jgi:hypothetical protein
MTTHIKPYVPADTQSLSYFLFTRILPVVSIAGIFLFTVAFGTAQIYERAMASANRPPAVVVEYLPCSEYLECIEMSTDLKAIMQEAVIVTPGVPHPVQPGLLVVPSATTSAKSGGGGAGPPSFSNTAKNVSLRNNPAIAAQIGIFEDEFEWSGSNLVYCKRVNELFVKFALDLIEAMPDDVEVEVGEFRNALKSLRAAQSSVKDALMIGQRIRIVNKVLMPKRAKTQE